MQRHGPFPFFRKNQTYMRLLRGNAVISLVSYALVNYPLAVMCNKLGSSGKSKTTFYKRLRGTQTQMCIYLFFAENTTVIWSAAHVPISRSFVLMKILGLRKG